MALYLLKDNQQTGPFEDAEVQSGLVVGKFSYDVLAWREGMAEWQPLSTVFPRATPPKPPVPVPNRDASLNCQTCGQGELVRRKTFRMSMPVVVIGYLLLIPSILGILFGGVILFTTLAAGGSTVQSSYNRARGQLEALAVPEGIIQGILSGKTISAAQKSSLTPRQQVAVQDAEAEVTGGAIGTGAGVMLGGAFSFGIIIFSFIFGLLGWLLVMKKKVLQCTHCQAVVAAS
jgi:GYF domain 2